MYRIMIVDDEPVIRKGLSDFIDWEALSCQIVCKAENGDIAVKNLETTKPDIVITDISMPLFDGLELSKHIYENYRDIKVIILTGHAEFEYARLAIKYGVVDFILKPTTNEKIIASVRNAVNLIESETESRKIIKDLKDNIENSTPYLVEKLLREIVDGIVPVDAVVIDRMTELSVNIRKYYMLLFKFSVPEEELSIGMHPAAPIDSCKNLIGVAFKEMDFYSVALKQNMICLICTFDEDMPNAFDKIMEKCHEIKTLSDNFMRQNIMIGMSSIHESVYELSDGFREAEDALKSNFYDNGAEAFVYMPLARKKDREDTNALSHIENLMDSLQKGDGESAENIVSEIFGIIKKSEYTPQEVKEVVVMIVSSCQILVSRYNKNISELSLEMNNIYRQVLECESMSKLEGIIVKMIRLVSEYMNHQRENLNSIISLADEYLKNNYMNDISLSAMAVHLHVNSSYLSRLYKKEKNLTITDSLANIRITKAKELLIENRYKTYEIANMVGIDDPAYFSQIFKKYTGFSPKEYKKQKL